MIAASSGATGSGLNGLMLAPPVLPDGTKPSAVFVAAPTMRSIWPRHSRKERCRQPHTSMCQCTRTCCRVEACPSTWARSRCEKAAAGSCSADALASSESTCGRMLRAKVGMQVRTMGRRFRQSRGATVARVAGVTQFPVLEFSSLERIISPCPSVSFLKL